MRKLKKRRGGDVGKFPEQQKKLIQLFTLQRNAGLRVTFAWMQARMLFICRRDKPEGWAKHVEKVGEKIPRAYIRRLCKREGISFQRRTNRKSKGIYERLHIIMKYHRNLIYKLQDPTYFDEHGWFDHKKYVQTRAEKSTETQEIEV